MSLGVLFEGLGVQKDTQAPCWLRLYAQKLCWLRLCSHVPFSHIQLSDGSATQEEASAVISQYKEDQNNFLHKKEVEMVRQKTSLEEKVGKLFANFCASISK